MLRTVEGADFYETLLSVINPTLGIARAIRSRYLPPRREGESPYDAEISIQRGGFSARTVVDVDKLEDTIRKLKDAEGNVPVLESDADVIVTVPRPDGGETKVIFAMWDKEDGSGGYAGKFSVSDERYWKEEEVDKLLDGV
ncbi:MAG TPA: hypothetical protein VI933_03615 [archaeon]|nr:hypothetical protein [archaeon]